MGGAPRLDGILLGAGTESYGPFFVLTTYVIFNIRGNRYRLVTVMHYVKVIKGKQTKGHVYIRSFLTHKEYDNPANWDRKYGRKKKK